eukprot:TRINITY_DN23482_c0_g1_i1.p2 TRINITY_DN23482_c0_g1~~TRINITY_DN23482_c0_g1_i1.p2  ORF type:complete len:101 (+),score=6.27 TRINITY_DN23482_c0_g1_i1:94-396(+)
MNSVYGAVVPSMPECADRQVFVHSAGNVETCSRSEVHAPSVSPDGCVVDVPCVPPAGFRVIEADGADMPSTEASSRIRRLNAVLHGPDGRPAGPTGVRGG